MLGGVFRARQLLLVAAFLCAAFASVGAACGGGSDAPSGSPSAIARTATAGGSTTASATASGSVAATVPDVKLANGAMTLAGKNVGGVDLSKLPLGNGKANSAPQRGYVYQCAGTPVRPANEPALPWVSSTTYNLLQKVWVNGEVKWPQATFSAVKSAAGRSSPVESSTGAA